MSDQERHRTKSAKGVADSDAESGVPGSGSEGSGSGAEGSGAGSEGSGSGSGAEGTAPGSDAGSGVPGSGAEGSGAEGSGAEGSGAEGSGAEGIAPGSSAGGSQPQGGVGSGRAGLLERLRWYVAEMIEESQKDRATGLAAEVAFFGVLSVFPGLLMLAAALGSLDSLAGSKLAERARETIVDFVQRVLTSEAQSAIDAVEQLFAERSRGVLTVGAVTALWSLTRGFDTLIRALDLAYDLEEKRSWIRRRLTALSLALGSVLMAVVVLAMIVIGPLFGVGQALANNVGGGELYADLWRWLRLPFAGALLVGWATTMFHIGPNHKTPWLRDLPGALLTAVLWLFASLGFSFYLRVAAAGNEIFGILGGGLTLLIWLYLLSLSIMVGAELNGIIAKERATLDASAGSALPI